MKAGWTEVALGEVVSPAPTVRAGAATYPILSMTMHAGLVNQSTKFTKRVASRETADYRVVRSGQLVVGFPIDEGVLAIQRLHPEGIVSPAYGVWDPVDRRIDARYLELYLRSPRAMSYYRTRLRGTTARRRSLPNDVFRSLPVPLPALDEQRRIAAILDQADELRAKRRVAIAHIDSLTEAIFLDMFGDPVSNPMSWPVTSIRDLAESLTYGSSEKALPAGRIPVLRMGNLTSTGRIITGDLKYVDEAKDKHLLEPGDLVFNRTNSAELVGKTAVFNQSGTWAYAGYLVRLRLTEAAEPTYVGAFMNLPSTKLKLRSMCKSIVGMANINAKELGTIRLPVPPIAAQRVFAQAVNAAENERLHADSATTQLDALFASLQARAFAGEL